jgi:hypothetical protein
MPPGTLVACGTASDRPVANRGLPHLGAPGAWEPETGANEFSCPRDVARLKQILLAGQGLPARLSPTVTDTPEFPDTEEVTGSNPVRPTRSQQFAPKTVSDGNVEALAQMLGLAWEIDTAIAEAVKGLRGCGNSWAEIGARLGITRQAAQQRWGASC